MSVLAGVIAIVALTGLCLFLLFRRGSLSDRARLDAPDPTDGPGHPDRPGPTDP
jgi:hypothetical protein